MRAAIAEAVAVGESPTHPRFVAYVVPSGYMRPTLEPGDIVEVDTSVTTVNGDGVYLIKFEIGQPALRRVQVLFDRSRWVARVWTDSAPESRDDVDPRSLRVLGSAKRAMCERRL